MEFDRRTRHASTGAAGTHDAPVPGKQTLTQGLVQMHPAAAPSSKRAATTPPVPAGPRPTLQMLFGRRDASDPQQVHAAAARGTATAAGQLPHLDQIQRSFGKHDVSGVQAHVGAEAAASAQEMGAAAFATGNHVVLGAGTDLHIAAHEAAHVVQQRGGVQLAGGVGAVGDTYEQHADQVADAVVRGESAEALLDQHAGGGGRGPAIQRVETATPGADNGHIVYGTKRDPDRLQPNPRINEAIDRVLGELQRRDPGKWNPERNANYGYMVGVAECVDGTLAVAMSGRFRDKFKESVGEQLPNAQIVGVIAAPKGQRTFEDFRGNKRVEDVNDDEKSYGDCAGPRILHWAQRKGPKKTPIALVEKFFSPERSGVSEYVHGTTVAPCSEHCEDLVPWMLQGRDQAERLGARQIATEKAEQRAQKQKRKQDAIDRELQKQANARDGEIRMVLFREGLEDDVAEFMELFYAMTLSDQANVDVEDWVATTLEEIAERRLDEQRDESQSSSGTKKKRKRKPKPRTTDQRVTGYDREPEPNHEVSGRRGLLTRTSPMVIAIGLLLVGLIIAALLAVMG